MIEIVLRRDIDEYEVKPFFGFTARQVVTAAVIIALSLVSYLLLSVVGPVPTSISLYVCFALGAAAGFVGLGKLRGLPFETWARLTLAERGRPRCMTYARPQLPGAPTSIYEHEVSLSRRDKRQLRREASEVCEVIE